MWLGRYELNKKSVFAILMGASALSLLLPPGWSNPVRHVAQLLVPPQDLLYSGSRHAVEYASRFGKPGPDEKSKAEQLELELASQAAAMEQLRAENDRLRRLRANALPLPTPVLPARVVARDAAAMRDSVLAARGTMRGVNSGDWVSARFFVDRGQASGVEEGEAVLAEHCLLGRIEQAGPYMARVQLQSDIDSRLIEARVGAYDGKRFQFVDYPCSVRGVGGQMMRIADVDYRLIRTNDSDESKDGKRRIGVGDLVFSAPGQLGLPTPMVMGRVTSVAENPRKRLVYNVEVEPIVKVEDVSEVYIIPLVPAHPVPVAAP